MYACASHGVLSGPAIQRIEDSVIKEVLSSVKTDLSMRQLLEFAGTLKESQKNGLKTDMVPGRPLYISGISYWIPDVEKLRTTLASTLGITLSGNAKTNLERAAKEYENSIPANATEVPASDHSIGRMSDTKSSSSSTSSSSSSKKSELKGSKNSDRTESRSSRTNDTSESTDTNPATRANDARSEDTQTSQTQSTAPQDDAPSPGAGSKSR